MDRRLLLVPASALYAWAQSSPDAAEAEQALRKRVEEFYQLQADNKFRQAEAYVAEDSKDEYYNARKQVVKDFRIEKIVLNEENTKANVVIKGKIAMIFGGVQEVLVPTETTWKIDNGKWCWYLDPAWKNRTPFGMMTTNQPQSGVPEIKGLDMSGKAPDLNEILKKIAIDRTLVEFSASSRSQSVKITNGTAGQLRLVIDPHVEVIKGLAVSLGQSTLDAGKETDVTFKWDGATAFDDTVSIRVDPYQRNFNVRVQTVK
jgi:hypothetical protein